ncbi:flagellar export chaperone FliS [Janthinobacterium agaricidamnosum]|uniref:Flagellar secretion chaperone FliS n=1 Tax=Janthinobacterium agaricidamnosum NBRC 102515 = DSM 9628 TaxID=1349767 RepID=W0V214_9BURK|nr:flagellar export chaperone FliS [Janthinobacterium agaricidamnosum]CDG81906.1 flagellar protein FliS [Janthinobacterium agaricidamnosum NBRC 102515 = DSM 9628]
MFGTRQNGVSAYEKVGMETGVVAASPHKLIVMLYDGALTALNMALMHMRAGNIAEKGKAISKALLIIDSGLRASLDKKVGGDIAEGLDSLYEYMSDRLLMANLKNQPEIIEEVQRLLIDLRDTWNAIGATPAAQSGSRPTSLTSAYP